MEPARKPRNLARDRILAQRALARGLVPDLHRRLQCGRGGLLVAALDRFKGTLRGGADASLDRAISLLALQALAMALLG